MTKFSRNDKRYYVVPRQRFTFGSDKSSSVPHDAAFGDFGCLGAALAKGVDEDALELLLVAGPRQIVDAEAGVGDEEVGVFELLLFEGDELHAPMNKRTLQSVMILLCK